MIHALHNLDNVVKIKHCRLNNASDGAGQKLRLPSVVIPARHSD